MVGGFADATCGVVMEDVEPLSAGDSKEPDGNDGWLALNVLVRGGADVGVLDVDAWLEGSDVPNTGLGCAAPKTEVEEGNAETPKGDGVLKTFGVTAIVEKS